MFFGRLTILLFVGEFKKSVETKTSNCKLLGPKNSKKGNGIEVSKGTVKVVTSRKGHQVRNLIPSLMTDEICNSLLFILVALYDPFEV